MADESKSLRGKWLALTLVCLFVSWKLLLHSTGVFSRAGYPQSELPEFTKRSAFAGIWSVWDSGFYWTLAKSGYPQNVYVPPDSWRADVMRFFGRTPDPIKAFQSAPRLKRSSTIENKYFKEWLEREAPVNELIPRTPYWLPTVFTTYPFKPLFPYLLRLGPVVGMDYLEFGLLISNLSLAASLALLYRLLRLDFDREFSTWAVIFYLINPLSCFLGGVQTEAFFNLLVIATLLLVRTGYRGPAAFTAALCALCRTNGFLILAPIAIVLWRENPRLQSVAKGLFPFVALTAVGMGAVTLWLYILTGDWLCMWHSYAAWKRKFPTSPWTLLTLTFKHINNRYLDAGAWMISVVIMTSAVIASCKRWIPKLPSEYMAYGFCAFIIPTLCGDIESYLRYTVQNPILLLGVTAFALKFNLRLPLLCFFIMSGCIMMYYWTRMLPILI